MSAFAEKRMAEEQLAKINLQIRLKEGELENLKKLKKEAEIDLRNAESDCWYEVEGE